MSRQETKEAFRGVGGCFGILFIVILVISSIQGQCRSRLCNDIIYNNSNYYNSY